MPTSKNGGGAGRKAVVAQGKPRDNFSPDVKRQLRERAGNMCSFVGCDLATTGPSEEKDGTASANTGEAAHITAAAAGPGARRYDDQLSKGARSALDNGIWCCRTHAKLIDTDDETFSVAMLKHWRVVAERRAQIAQRYGQKEALRLVVGEQGLAPDKLEFKERASSERIHKVFSLSLIAEFIPEESWHAVRDFVFEHMDNAFRHGGAKKFEIEFYSHSIALRDDGGDFDLARLVRTGERDGGGLFAYKVLLEHVGCPPILLNGINGMRECRIQVRLTKGTMLSQNPCAFDIPVPHHNPTPEKMASESVDFRAQLASKAGCATLFLVGYTATTITHIRDLGPRIEDALSTGKKVVVCFPETSRRVVEEYKVRFPKIETLFLRGNAAEFPVVPFNG